MAGEALAGRIKRLMGNGRLLDLLLLVRVTGQAEIAASLGRKIVLEVSAMRAVAAYAPQLHWRMNELRALNGLGLVRVAVEADLIPVSREKFRKIALVHVVTSAATSFGNRTMDEFAAGDNGFVVAKKAEIAPGSSELELVRGLMRTMALGALTLLHRCMNNLLRGQLPVAFGTELSHIGYRFEFMFSCLFMTGFTLTHRHGPMDKLIFPHFGVTFVGYARLLRLGGFISLGRGSALVTVR